MAKLVLTEFHLRPCAIIGSDLDEVYPASEGCDIQVYSLRVQLPLHHHFTGIVHYPQVADVIVGLYIHHVISRIRI